MSTPLPKMRVLISGAGIAGSTLAWFLSKAGACVTVVEKAHALQPHGQNVDMTGSAITAIKKMGLFEKVQEYHTTEKGGRIIGPSGKIQASFPQTGGSASPTSEFEILRGDLAALLYNAANELADVKYRFGTTVKEVVSNDDKAVKVELSSGEIEEYDMLVAADGQWSKVRSQCFPPESVEVVDKDMYAVYWTIPRLPSDDEWWNVYSAPDSRLLSLRPDPHGTMRAMLTKMPLTQAERDTWAAAQRWNPSKQQEHVKRQFADAGWQAPRFLAAMDEAPDFYFQAIKQIRMDKWSTGRVICLGDAAFCPTPLTGQGVTLAITSAYLLAGELCTLPPGEHPSRAFDAYEEVFRPHVQNVQKIPAIFPGIVHPRSAWQRWLLQSFLWALSKLLLWTPGLSGGSGESHDDGFPLPAYAKLDGMIMDGEKI